MSFAGKGKFLTKEISPWQLINLGGVAKERGRVIFFQEN